MNHKHHLAVDQKKMGDLITWQCSVTMQTGLAAPRDKVSTLHCIIQTMNTETVTKQVLKSIYGMPTHENCDKENTSR